MERLDWLDMVPKKARIYIYGAGKYGKSLYDVITSRRKDIEFLGFIDGYKSGENIVSWKEFRELKPECDVVVIGSEAFWKTMKDNVESIGYKCLVPVLHGFSTCESGVGNRKEQVSIEELEKFEKVCGMISVGAELYKAVIDARLSGNFSKISDYFHKVKKSYNWNRYIEHVEFHGGEVVIEGGVFVGEVTRRILEAIGDKGILYGFDIYGDKFLDDDLKGDPRLKIYKLALWSKSTALYFPKSYEETCPDGTYVCEDPGDGSERIKSISIDEFVAIEDIPRVDYIKMDIEGAEPEALEGARETIKEFKPNIAIAVYHEISHYYRIPLFLKGLYEGYKVIFDHYSSGPGESIMYFIR